MGNGLGLSICQNILKCLNGRIAVDSKLGAGSTFTIFLETVKQPLLQIEE
jgi:C4-dicarboxylate-specific signal transduction histidine kinase